MKESRKTTEKCREVFALLSEYLNLELPPAACQDLEAHIASCPACLEFAESLRKTVDLCRHYEPSEVPEPFGRDAREELFEACQRMLCGRNSAPLFKSS